ncbi:MAG: sporulation protein YabP [Lachnospiraceae bacterium]|nr:sporulation protein YabP [Lachnospiraceae bacterium]
MEERRNQQSHVIHLTDRQSGTVSGVLDVVSFDDKVIILNTQCGKITIKGSNLLVNQLSLEKGEVSIEGNVDTLLYSEAGRTKGEKKESLLGRMFQ